MEINDFVIETNNLILKPIDSNCIKDIFVLFNTNIAKYMTPQPAKAIIETEKFVLSSIDENNEGSNLELMILNKTNTQFMGLIGLHDIKSNDPELGLWLGEPFHGKGYGLEAATAVINWAKKQLKFDYIKYPVDKRNIASRKIPEKNGGIIFREFKSRNWIDFELDQVEYRIIREKNGT